MNTTEHMEKKEIRTRQLKPDPVISFKLYSFNIFVQAQRRTVQIYKSLKCLFYVSRGHSPAVMESHTFP
ncbi:hypothetical protein D3C71_1328160 [compost metagenome]